MCAHECAHLLPECMPEVLLGVAVWVVRSRTEGGCTMGRRGHAGVGVEWVRCNAVEKGRRFGTIREPSRAEPRGLKLGLCWFWFR